MSYCKVLVESMASRQFWDISYAKNDSAMIFGLILDMYIHYLIVRKNRSCWVETPNLLPGHVDHRLMNLKLTV